MGVKGKAIEIVGFTKKFGDFIAVSSL